MGRDLRGLSSSNSVVAFLKNIVLKSNMVVAKSCIISSCIEVLILISKFLVNITPPPKKKKISMYFLRFWRTLREFPETLKRLLETSNFVRNKDVVFEIKLDHPHYAQVQMEMVNMINT